jgi:RNA polymerase sigma-70 factor (ECF subfamily)
MDIMIPESVGEPAEDVERAAAGDAETWQRLVDRHHRRLRRMISLRLDVRLAGRVDPSDVLQEAYLDAYKQLPDYVREPKIPFFLWLRLVAGSRLARTHRFHLGAQQRTPVREVSLQRGPVPGASSAALAAHLMGAATRPSEAAVRAELRLRLQEALNTMEEIDREVLALRHFEQLTSREVAQELDITEAAAGKRYLRALARLKEILKQSPGGLGDWQP